MQECGDDYRRVYWNLHDRKGFVWRCVLELSKVIKSISTERKEGDLYDAVMAAIINSLLGVIA